MMGQSDSAVNLYALMARYRCSLIVIKTFFVYCSFCLVPFVFLNSILPLPSSEDLPLFNGMYI